MTIQQSYDEPMIEPAAKRASGSSFYAAMRIMPPGQREAMFEIYSFCRAVDDVADDEGPRDGRLEQIALWRNDINALYAGVAAPRVAGLVVPMRDFRLERKDFLAVIDGMEMDILADIRAPSFETLDLYCDRVASAVGRLSVKVFGLERADGLTLAHHLGRALQLTNILRDVDEDASMGRLYLAREWLDAAGIDSSDPATVIESPALGEACKPALAIIERHFAAADAVMNRYPRRIVRTPRLMSEAYKVVLQKLIARGWSLPRERVRISRPYLLWLVLRHALV
ncbi:MULTISPECIES: presqualene diphosphate synthase HpnD [Rhodomicrobium]|uniref:presqualene diphosphate synthase HpnD n=1 Tax=Rhodomicrobium TaxID=1068 RepID=UPI000B4BAE1F|nr:MULTISPECIES: presqualene diphosphate synthase HpnD [Rhodomicrobium]